MKPPSHGYEPRRAVGAFGQDERGPYVLAHVDDMDAVEDALAPGWTVGDNWWASDPSQEIRPGLWKLYLMLVEDVGGAKNAKLEVEMPQSKSLADLVSRHRVGVDGVWLEVRRVVADTSVNYPTTRFSRAIDEAELERLFTFVGAVALVLVAVRGARWLTSRPIPSGFLARDVKGRRVLIDAEDDEMMADAVAETLRTGRPVVANRDEAGNVTVQVLGDDQ